MCPQQFSPPIQKIHIDPSSLSWPSGVMWNSWTIITTPSYSDRGNEQWMHCCVRERHDAVSFSAQFLSDVLPQGSFALAGQGPGMSWTHWHPLMHTISNDLLLSPCSPAEEELLNPTGFYSIWIQQLTAVPNTEWLTSDFKSHFSFPTPQCKISLIMSQHHVKIKHALKIQQTLITIHLYFVIYFDQLPLSLLLSANVLVFWWQIVTPHGALLCDIPPASLLLQQLRNHVESERKPFSPRSIFLPFCWLLTRADSLQRSLLCRKLRQCP